MYLCVYGYNDEECTKNVTTTKNTPTWLSVRQNASLVTVQNQPGPTLHKLDGPAMIRFTKESPARSNPVQSRLEAGHGHHTVQGYLKANASCLPC